MIEIKKQMILKRIGHIETLHINESMNLEYVLLMIKPDNRNNRTLVKQ